MTPKGYSIFGESLIDKKYRNFDVMREFFKRMEEHVFDVHPQSEYAVFGSIKRSKIIPSIQAHTRS